MEFTKEYTGARWEIVYGNYEGMEKHAIDLVQAELRAGATYVPEMLTAPSGTKNVIFVGTAESNPHLKALLGKTVLPENESYVKVFRDGDRQIALVAGGDPAACFYAAVEFADDYLPAARRRPVGHPFFRNVFEAEELPAYEHSSHPATRDRGLWTWGHVIYDYRSYLRNMARLKFNKITVWNDFPPVNAKEFVEYAHSWGIRVVWGYTWGWDQKSDTEEPDSIDVWKERICAEYRNGYNGIGDGIYFQTSFTETGEQTLNGASRARRAVEWVNPIADALLAEFPNLKIEFGLHATSVRNDLAEIAKTDPRVAITWEDCGAFPYAYGAQNMADADGTMEFTKQIARLRGGNGFGVVFKGITWLDWAHFEHQFAPFVLGESNEAEIAEKTAMRRDTIRYQQGYWMENGDYARKIFETIADLTNGGADLEVLLEDGMFDRHIWLPAALFAEMLWEPKQEFGKLVGKVMRRPCVETV